MLIQTKYYDADVQLRFGEHAEEANCEIEIVRDNVHAEIIYSILYNSCKVRYYDYRCNDNDDSRDICCFSIAVLDFFYYLENIIYYISKRDFGKLQTMESIALFRAEESS